MQIFCTISVFSVHSVQAAVVKKKFVCSVISVVSTLCPRPSIFHLVDQQPLVLSCGLWINYSSDVTQQKPLFIICVTRQFLNQNPGSQPHMKGTAITDGGGRGVKTSHQYFFFLPPSTSGLHTDRLACY